MSMKDPTQRAISAFISLCRSSSIEIQSRPSFAGIYPASVLMRTGNGGRDFDIRSNPYLRDILNEKLLTCGMAVFFIFNEREENPLFQLIGFRSAGDDIKMTLSYWSAIPSIAYDLIFPDPAILS